MPLTVLVARLAKPRHAAAALVAPMIPRRAPRLSPDDQLLRLVAIVSGGVRRTEASNRLHAAAEVQLDAASYALRELVQDLSAVMTLPERRGASLLQLPPGNVRVLARRKVAVAA
jgi:hypothetical protein